MLTGEEHRVNRFSKWIPFGVGAVVFGVVLISVACGTTSSASSKSTEMRVVHLAPNEQALDLLIDNKVVFSGLAYGVPTAFAGVTAVKHDFKLDLSIGTQNVLEHPAEPFTAGTSYTYLVIESGGIQVNRLEDDHTVADKGNFKLRVVNGSPNSGPVDVYIVTPGTATVTTISGIASNAASPYQSLASGSYQIYISTGGHNTCLDSTPVPVTCLIHLDGLNGTAVPAFQAGQNRTLIMLNQIPGGGSYTTLPMLADLN